MKFTDQFRGGDLRSIGDVDRISDLVKDQASFDRLFEGLMDADRLVVMRSADAIEKITRKKKEFLYLHKEEIFNLLLSSKNKELQWHLSLLIPRLNLDQNQLRQAVDLLKQWALDRDQSRIVRVNAIQALYELRKKSTKINEDLKSVIKEVLPENIPSINARIRKLNL